MSTPLLILFGPAAAGTTLLLLRRFKRATALLGVGLALLLLVVVALIEPGTTTVLGRSLNVDERLLSLLRFLYATQVLLSGIALWLPQGRDFTALSLLVSAPLAGALMIEPFVFGAAFLALAAGGLSLMAQGTRPGPTLPALRVLVVTLVAMALLLVAGWMLNVSQGSYLDTVALFFAVAFVILLAGFPFHFWIAPLLRQAPPLVIVFALGLAQLLVAFFCIQLLVNHSPVTANGLFLNLVILSGVTTTAVAGLLALLSRTTAGLVGYLMLIDAGTVVFTLGFSDMLGLETTLLMLTARVPALLAVTLGFALNQPAKNRSSTLAGLPHNYLGLGLTLLGGLSLIGLPLTIGFNGRYAALTLLASRAEWLALIVLVGLACGVVALFRSTLNSMAGDRQTAGPPTRPKALHVIGAIVLVGVALLGLYPRPLLAFVHHLAGLL
ncbi:MAG: hypothetical protein R3300_21335 [Candidatus Promineifilaceae bacterium]|nr:hypothetical protein [Candidatus Promineifilaceae bacterium]